MRQTRVREIRIGLVIVTALAAIAALIVVASGGPGFLSARKTLVVVFRDAQGVRPGSSVRVAGLEVGRVDDVDLTEHEGSLRAQVKLSIPASLAGKLRHNAQITIAASLTGQSTVSIVSMGSSKVPLVNGEIIVGAESTVFDPILEQVGLGAEERKDISHTIGKLRQTVDDVSPRLRLILDNATATMGGVRETTDAVRPVVEDFARRLEKSGPRLEATLASLEQLTSQTNEILAENRPNVQETLASVRDLSVNLRAILATDKVKIEKVLDGLDKLRIRADRSLYNVEVLTSQGVQILSHNRAAIERTIFNVRDATDWADQLVQKIYGNPFLISPLYKPTAEDVRTQAVGDTARLFVKGARELSDLVKTMQSLQANAQTPQQKQELEALYKRANVLIEMLGQTEKQLAEGFRPQTRR